MGGKLLTFVGVRRVDIQIEVLSITETRNAHDLTLDLKYGEAGAVEVDLQCIFARLEPEEDRRRHGVEPVNWNLQFSEPVRISVLHNQDVEDRGRISSSSQELLSLEKLGREGGWKCTDGL